MRNLLPSYIVEPYQRGISSGAFDAATLFIDISGFTAITEKLGEQGSEGAEILSSILNTIFEPAVDAVYKHGGFIATFAGDAFTAVFPVEDDESMRAALLRAIECAHGLHRLLEKDGRQSTRFGELVVTSKVGISAGVVDWGIVEAGDRRTCYLRGNGVLQCAMAEHLASSGEVMLDASMLDYLDDGDIDALRVDDRVARITSFSVRIPKRKSTPVAAIRRQTMLQFLPESIVDAEPWGEFRDVASVFLGFSGFDRKEALDRFLSIVLTLADQHGGYLKDIDFAGGGVITCFFGAPASYENDVERAVRFALAVRDAGLHGDFPESVSIRGGIGFGRVFAGIVGGRKRAQYTLLGATVNLAARMMARARPGEILASSAVTRGSPHTFEFAGEMLYKNIGNPIPTYVLLSEVAEAHPVAGHLIGGERSLSLLQDFMSPIFSGRCAGVAYIYGDAGIGKTQLVVTLRQRIERSYGVKWISCSADPILRHPLNPFARFLFRYLGLAAGQSGAETKKLLDTKVDRLVEALRTIGEEKPEALLVASELDRTRSFLGALVGIGWEGSLYEQLDPKGRYENTLYALKALIVGESHRGPTVVHVEDGQWLDDESIGFIRFLSRGISGSPLVIVVTARYNDDGSLPRVHIDDLPGVDLHLSPFGREEVRALAEQELAGAVDDALVTMLLDLTRGNPFFIMQMLAYFSDNRMLEYVDAAWHAKEDLRRYPIGLPDTINAILVARLDRLSRRVKDVVKAAAVIGQDFEVELLSRMLKSDIADEVQKAEQRRIWEMMTQLQYAFKHVLLRDAAYEMQLHVRIRDLHRLAAESMEELYTDTLPGRYAEIAYHYEKAEVRDKAVAYLRRAAEYSASHYQNREAISLYRRALAQAGDPLTPYHVELLVAIGDLHELLGEWTAADESYRRALDTAESLGDEALVAEANRGLAWIHVLRGEHDLAMQALERQRELCARLNDRRGLAMALGHMGVAHRDRGDLEQAMELYRERLEICTEIGDTAGMAATLGNIGNLHRDRGNYDLALEAYGKDLELSRSLEERKSEATTTINMGVVYKAQGKIDEADACYRTAMGICEEIGYRQGLAAAAANLASIQHGRGQYESALANYRLGLSLATESGDRRAMAYALGNIGGVYRDMEEFDQALESYRQQQVLSQQIGNQYALGYALGNMGLTLGAQRKNAEAIGWYRQALQVHRAIDEATGVSYWLSNMIEAALITAEPNSNGSSLLDEAAIWAQDLIALARENNDARFESTGALLAAKVDFALGKRDQAVLALEELTRRVDDNSLQAMLHYELGRMEQQQGRDDIAHEQFQQSLSLYDRLYASTPRIEYKERIEELKGAIG